MASKFGYRLTQKAESDLDGIVSYIAVELSNPPAASDFVNKLQENIEEARNFPESGSLMDSLHNPTQRTDIRSLNAQKGMIKFTNKCI